MKRNVRSKKMATRNNSRRVHKDAIVIPRSNAKSFLMGAVVTVFLLTLVAAVSATFYLGTDQLISKVSTGTAPFVVSSTTKVTNLNADLLDGLDSAALDDTPSQWTCTVRSATSSATSSASKTASVACSGSEKVIVAGCDSTGITDGNDIVYGFISSSQVYTCVDVLDAAVSHTVTAYANCCT